MIRCLIEDYDDLGNGIRVLRIFGRVIAVWSVVK